MRPSFSRPAVSAAWLLLLFAQSIAAEVCVQQKQAGCSCSAGGAFRVLALGDSLTKGAVPSKSTNHPYSIKLQQLLQTRFGSRAKVSVDTAGYDYMGVIQKAVDDSGKQLDLTLVPYANSLLGKAATAGQPYNWVVVMAGINDLGNSNKTAAEVMPKLIEVYNAALKSGASVLAVAPFPNRFVSQSSRNEKQRLALIGMMRDYVASRPPRTSCDQPKLHLLELPATDFDFWNMPAGRVAQMQDDLLHLTADGYDILGGVIFDKISRETPLNTCLCPSSSRSSSSKSGGGGGTAGGSSGSSGASAGSSGSGSKSVSSSSIGSVRSSSTGRRLLL